MVFSYLQMINGDRAGANILLDEARTTRIGRGLECDVVLSDPLSSRVHSIVVCEEGLWWVRDAGSRNGTYLNGQKVDEARLAEPCHLKVGSTEFSFHQSLIV